MQVNVNFLFTFDHTKIIFPLATVTTRENKFSMLIREKNITMTGTNVLYVMPIRKKVLLHSKGEHPTN